MQIIMGFRINWCIRPKLPIWEEHQSTRYKFDYPFFNSEKCVIWEHTKWWGKIHEHAPGISGENVHCDT